MPTVVKQPSEALKYELSFASILTGFSIDVIDDLSVEVRGLVAEVDPIVVTQVSVQGVSLFIRVAGGTDGETYHVRALAVDTNAETHEADVEVIVQDLTFTVPDAPSANTYVTPAAYVGRFGVQEAIDLTDEQRLGRIDTAALYAALADAAAEIDGYVGGKYTVPLDPVPALVEGIAADLTRARLHTGVLPEHVERNQAEARRKLRDIAKGALVLAETTPKSSGQGTPIYDAPERMFTRDKLRGF